MPPFLTFFRFSPPYPCAVSYAGSTSFISGLFDIVVDAAEAASLDVGGELHFINDEYNGAFTEYDAPAVAAMFAIIDAV